MTNIEPASPEHRMALADIITDKAEEIFTRAQHLETQAKALHRAAWLLFGEADRLSPTEKLSADNDDVEEDHREIEQLMNSINASHDCVMKLIAELGDPDLDQAA